MFPSLPPQNRKYSQGSKVTDMISTSKRTDKSSSPEDSSHTWSGQRKDKHGRQTTNTSSLIYSSNTKTVSDKKTTNFTSF